MKGVLLRVGVEGVRALALVERASATEFLAAAFEFHSVAVQHVLNGTACLMALKSTHCVPFMTSSLDLVD